MTVRILIGDARARLAELPDESVHCVVTSPPYFGLRDYGNDGQMGLESSPAEFVAELVGMLREVRRVLRHDGTLWLNLGDTYANDGKWGGSTGGKHARGLHDEPVGRGKRHTGLKPKDLIGIPWRVAFALQDDGWWLRQDIVWSKPNPMPESVDDRCTKAHEYLFLLSKAQTYFYDAEAILEGLTESSVARMNQNLDAQAGSFKVPGKANAIKPAARQRGLPPRHAQYESSDQSGLDDAPRGMGRNKRSVWTVPTVPLGLDMCRACRHVYQPRAYRALRREQVWEGEVRRPDIVHCECGRTDAWLSHFATFPPDLVRDCILAGSPALACATCGAPHVRVCDKELKPTRKGVRAATVPDGRHAAADPQDQGSNRKADGHLPGWAYEVTTLGFRPSCECAGRTVPGVVLDPFGGAGTTGLVAERLGREALLIELNEDYAELARVRLRTDLARVESEAPEVVPHIGGLFAHTGG